MTMNQLKYVVTLAKTLNFTKAADILFMTQPALSRQIALVEEEIGMKLFIRNSRSVELSPATAILAKTFEKIYDEYQKALTSAKERIDGISGTLNIGILEGMYIGDFFPEIKKSLTVNFPDIEVVLHTYSFGKIIQALYDDRLDIAFTLLFDVQDRNMLSYKILEKTKDYIVVNKNHRLAGASYVKLTDFMDDTIITVSPEDSYISEKLITEACKKSGFTPKIKHAASLSEEIFWVESGVGVCILDSRCSLYDNKNVRFLQTDEISKPYLTMAWHTAHTNPTRKIFIENFLACYNNITQNKISI